MGLLGLGVLLVGVLGAAVEAEDTTVTVYKDRTLVERTTLVNLAGTERVVWPLLMGKLEASSVRVQAEGAEVQRVELRPTYVPAFTAEEVRAAIEAVGPPRSSADEEFSPPMDWYRAAAHAESLATRPSPSALEVAAMLEGTGATRVVLSYFLPAVKSKYLPALSVRSQDSQVEAEFRGQIFQNTGADWNEALFHFAPGQSSPVFDAPRPTPVWLDQPDALEEESAQRRQMFGAIGYSTAPIWAHPESRQPEAPPTVLTGTVLDVNTGAPLKDVVVNVFSEHLRTDVFTFTDVRGEYRITDLPPASAGYRLSFQREDVRPWMRERMDIPRASTVRVDVRLWTGAGPDPEPPPPPSRESQGGCGPNAIRLDPVFMDFVMTNIGQPEPATIPPPRDFARLAAPVLDAPWVPDWRLTVPGRQTLRDRTAPRFPLFTETWPMTVHRQVFPAQDTATYLVAEVHASPTRELIMHEWVPLAVDGQPHKSVKLLPLGQGSTFTLPLGTDPKVRAERTEQRAPVEWHSREVHDVTVRVPNPYPVPMSVRVLDTWPKGSRLVRATPGVQRDDATGGLTWDLKVPPASTGTVSFRYSR
ncbi:carboxypeptidase regulatory-like domain-containing protein [Corallococcus sp. AS-1-6]|uniref:carboxypeptidase regulatory-like domain-containing protein n=1 Tax=Corallococcus sp. AS-1-6 TaxID=2874599 RepID=UPI001CC0EBC7|nr:carboxypeptidase regulatory-like domain-containing protein [Corallococcus sp. AS-1-6]MBZ4372885.1 carboxypeptidase regulatory-like domain-containing protein [Corallococcus sp. AS-1-6]